MQILEPKHHAGGIEAPALFVKNLALNMAKQIARVRELHDKAQVRLRESVSINRNIS